MSNKYKLVYSPTFYDDLDAIISYIKYKLKNFIAADNLLKRIEKEIYNRLRCPEGYKKYKTKDNNIYYRIYVNNYIILYTISNYVMTIRKIIYSRRDLTKLL